VRSHAGSASIEPPDEVHSQLHLTGWLLEWLGSICDSKMDITLMIMYHIWLARNDARETQRMEDPVCVANRAIHLAEEWRNAQDLAKPKPPQPREHWLPPAMGWTKINADGATAKHSDKGGGGVVIRDHDGRFLAGACHFFPSLSGPEGAELRACRRAISLGQELGLSKIILETDNMGVVSKLTSVLKDRSAAGPLVEEMKALLRAFDDHAIRWARRSANGVAHNLAREGCGSETCKTWFSISRDCIVNNLALDIPRFS
jgi:ribonuclease HI